MASSDSLKPRHVLGTGLAALMVIGGIAGCGHTHKSAATGLFDDQQQATLTCMTHQSQRPGPLYTGAAQHADTAHILQMMQYYTSNGAKPYCDGASPTTIDQAWARLYVSLGGQAVKVHTASGGS